MMRNFIAFAFLCFLVSCSNSTLQEELDKSQEELTIAETIIENLNAQMRPKGSLVHILFFKIKPNTDKASLVAGIKPLKEIEYVNHLQYGFFKDIGDQRALSGHTMMLEMSFDNEATYRKYEKHPIHVAVKENVNQFLAGPPITYDYIQE